MAMPRMTTNQNSPVCTIAYRRHHGQLLVSASRKVLCRTSSFSRTFRAQFSLMLFSLPSSCMICHNIELSWPHPYSLTVAILSPCSPTIPTARFPLNTSGHAHSLHTLCISRLCCVHCSFLTPAGVTLLAFLTTTKHWKKICSVTVYPRWGGYGRTSHK